MRGRWLTPNELPGTTRCWAISIPDSVDFLALLKGAIDDLRFSSNFEEFGDLSADDTASAFAVAFDTIAECAGGATLTGEIIAYATANPPAGTLACDGATYLRVDYPDLYAVLATAFISDSDHFVTPDLRGRSIVGIGQGTGLTNRVMGASGGEEGHVLSVGEQASHLHTGVGASQGRATTGLIDQTAGGMSGSTQFGAVLANTGLRVDFGAETSSGGGGSHNTMHPYQALGYAIVT